MKKVYLFAFGFLSLATVFGQRTASKENMGIGTVSPDQSAVLDIQSVNKGLLIPRLTIEQRNSITQPANGLMVYQTNEKSGFYFFNGEFWKPIGSDDAKSVATLDINGWALDGNVVGSANKAIATSASFIGVPASVPLNFKIGTEVAGTITNLTLRNTFIGYEAGEISVGIQNSGFGAEALKLNTSGIRNVAFGRAALSSNVSGSGNAAFGANALISSNGGNNMAIGFSAMALNTTGSDNVAIGSEAFFDNVAGNNNIAIGSKAGRKKLGSNNIYLGYDAGSVAVNTNESNKLYIANSNTTMPLVYGDFSAKYVTIGDVTPALRSQGTATGGYNLLVKGGILTEKVKVALAAAGTDWADYVFEPEYKSKMMSLEEVEKFTLENKHLPNVPSAEEMIKSGLDVSQTSKMFMEKIEELTLYLIELNKEVKALKAENNLLKGKK